MKGGYTILDIKKCEFALNAGETEYVANNSYAKNIVNAVWNSQKPVLIENLSSLGGDFEVCKGSGFCYIDVSGTDYIGLSLPNSNGTTIEFDSNGTISIIN